MYEANYSVYACYKNSDGSSSSYLVESGYDTCLDLDKFTYDYCLNKITWSFEWIEIIVYYDDKHKFKIKKNI